MLENLSIRNYLILREVDVDFCQGLSVLTGQTGSGKSILLDAIEVVLGQKQIKKDIVSSDEKDTSISISFSVKSGSNIEKFLFEHSLESEEKNELIIRRIFKKNGSQKNYINDQPISISVLKQLGRLLLDYNSQGDQFKLLNKNSYKTLVDQYGNHGDILTNLSEIYHRYVEEKDSFENLKRLEEARKKEIDYLHHTIAEIEKLNLTENEEEVLDQKRRKFLNYEKTRQIYQEVAELLSEREGAVSQNILKMIKTLSSSSMTQTKENEEIIAGLENALQSVQDVEARIEEQFGDLESEDIDQIQERLFKIREIARKHQCQSAELPKKLDELKAEIHNLENAEKLCKKSEELYKKYESEFRSLASDLSAKRKKVAEILAEKILRKLTALDLSKARFSISVSYNPELISQDGSDVINFEVSMNPGIALAPVDAVASGGELSRFLLAMKTVLAEHLPVSVLIFDEIDSGVSGSVASAIGEELRSLSKSNQLLVVTHSPQIITFADQHYLVCKQNDSELNYTESSVKLLDKEEQKEEVARLLSGQKITENARILAEEMLKG